MDWAIGAGARVLSMSLGFRGFWEDFIAITDILRFRGMLPVIAAGNVIHRSGKGHRIPSITDIRPEDLVARNRAK